MIPEKDNETVLSTFCGKSEEGKMLKGTSKFKLHGFPKMANCLIHQVVYGSGSEGGLDSYGPVRKIFKEF